MKDGEQQFGGLWVRILAFAFDYLALAIYLMVLVAMGLTVNSNWPEISRTLFGNPWMGQLICFIILTLPVTLYFALQESSPRQATWGKRRLGLKVTGHGGQQLTRRRAIGRTLLKFIPWELAHTCIWQVTSAPEEPSTLISAGFWLVWLLVGANIVWLWISPTRQTIYDRLAGTYVVRSLPSRTGS